MNDKELKEQLKKEMLDLCETNSSVMTYMECLMRKYENLQSKIDKANKILNADTYVENCYYGLWNLLSTDDFKYEIDNKEINDILKEDK